MDRGVDVDVIVLTIINNRWGPYYTRFPISKVHHDHRFIISWRVTIQLAEDAALLVTPATEVTLRLELFRSWSLLQSEKDC